MQTRDLQSEDQTVRGTCPGLADLLRLGRGESFCLRSYLARSLTLEMGVLLRGGDGGRDRVTVSPQSLVLSRVASAVRGPGGVPQGGVPQPPQLSDDAVRYSSSEEKRMVACERPGPCGSEWGSRSRSARL